MHADTGASRAPGKTSKVGFFTDTSLCIGCKACEVACKQWNQVPDDGMTFTGMSYDNTAALGAATWRHVTFAERPRTPATDATAFRPPVPMNDRPNPGSDGVSWKMMSDVCKHCERAGCLEACPTGAIHRTEFGTVHVQPDVCNGCGACVPACPFGVIDRHEVDGRAWKCTLCYDRLEGGLEPACAKACPTDSIQFGDLDELRERARKRVDQLHARGFAEARLYGHDADDQPGTEGLHAFFLLMDEPEVYNLPADPVVPTKTAKTGWTAVFAAAAALVAAIFAIVALGARGRA